MKRRELLASITSVITASIAGCARPDTNESTTQPRLVETEPETQRTTTTNSFLSDYSTAEITTSDDIPLEYTASLEPTPTETHPPRVKITLTNPTKQALRFADTRTAFFWLSTENRYPIRAYPPTPETKDTYSNTDCWKRNQPATLTADLQTKTLDAGESVTKTAVLAVTPYENCPSKVSNSLEFSSEIQVAELTFTETGSYWSDVSLHIK